VHRLDEETGIVPRGAAVEIGEGTPVRRALSALAAGRPVVVLDDGPDGGEGDLVVPAELATPALLAFLVRHTSGFLSVALPASECDRLELPALPRRHRNERAPDYCVSVDLQGTGTGISAADRSRTVAALAAAGARAADFTRPGHVVPVAVEDGGVRQRPRRGEAAVDLARLSGLRPAAAMATIVSRERPLEMARGPELARFADDHGLEVVPVSRLSRYLSAVEPPVVRGAAAPMPGALGRGRRVVSYQGRDGAEHRALVAGDVDGLDVPVHVHTGCVTRDVLRARCACGAALDSALSLMAATGRGIVVHAYPGDTLRACGERGRRSPGSVPVGEVVASVLADLGVTSVRLLDVMPDVQRSLRDHGLGRSATASGRALAG
jgi:3,4-dihydroxy 2-butanone 4-phosphate synthase/GTP cyclohydrolase II